MSKWSEESFHVNGNLFIYEINALSLSLYLWSSGVWRYYLSTFIENNTLGWRERRLLSFPSFSMIISALPNPLKIRIHYLSPKTYFQNTQNVIHNLFLIFRIFSVKVQNISKLISGPWKDDMSLIIVLQSQSSPQSPSVIT